MRRVPEVIDGWFDSGAMPFAQWHYPFENAETFEEQFPADFICEAIDQTRGWFYSLHAIAHAGRRAAALQERALPGPHPRRRGPEDVARAWATSSTRTTCSTTRAPTRCAGTCSRAQRPCEPKRFSAEIVDEVVRKFILTLWNTYCVLRDLRQHRRLRPDGAASAGRRAADARPLDPRRARTRSIATVTDGLDDYDATARRPRHREFVDELSNWYVRRSRRRFWKSESDADKLAAYLTLYECLVTVAKLLAPFMPFIAEELYQNLVRSVRRRRAGERAPGAWPVADERAHRRRLLAETGGGAARRRARPRRAQSSQPQDAPAAGRGR